MLEPRRRTEPGDFFYPRDRAVSGRYWSERHRDALSKAEQSRDPALREIYLELADHYRAMEALVAASSNSEEARKDRARARQHP